MASVLTTIRQRPLYELGVGYVIPNADISAFAANTVTAARWFNNTNMSADYLQINNAGLQGTDYWLLGKRPYSDFEALDNETDTITIDEDYLMEAVYLEIAQALYQEYGEDRWQRLYDWAAGRVALQQVVRQPLQPEPVRQFIRYSA